VPLDVELHLAQVGPGGDLDVVEEGVLDHRADVSGLGEDLVADFIGGPGLKGLDGHLLRDVLREDLEGYAKLSLKK